MEYAILGPLTAYCDGTPVPLRGKRSAVVATLLLHPGAAVTRDKLVSWLWDEPPKSAVANVQTYVSQLRRSRIGVDHDGDAYRLGLDGHRLDLVEFEDAIRAGRRAADAGAADRAHVAFERAFALWRGRPAENVPLALPAHTRIAELEERARNARTDWIDVRLRLGLLTDVITEVSASVEADPLREQPWRQLITALHRAGRRAEALRAFHRARAALVAELGVEPGPELRDLHLAVLHDEPPDSPPHPPDPPQLALTGMPQAAAPGCQLPPDIADFVGRAPELAAVDLALNSNGAAPPIVVLSGPPGVGKTTIAVHAAHRVRAAYPEGQLFVRLHDGDHKPRHPGDLLGELLRLLGVDGAVVPPSTAERAALYRARMADRRILVVLDDAADDAQVEPLLPGTSATGVLVTSRHPLVALPGTTPITVAAPGAAEATALLARLISRDRVEEDPEATEALLAACGHLPLAIRVAAARLTARPAWPVSALSSRLRDARSRLDELRAGSLDVRATFDAAYATLPGDARLIFRLAGRTGADSLAPWAFAGLLGEPPASARTERVLETLTGAGFLTAHERDAAGQLRYRMHGLLRSFAQERAAGRDRAGEAEAVRRLVAQARTHVVTASRQLPLCFAPPPPGSPDRVEPSPDARAWLAAERATLLSLIDTADELVAAAALACDLTPYLINAACHDDAVRVLDTVASHARATGAREIETRLRLVRADVEVDRGRVSEASQEFHRLRHRGDRAADEHTAAYALTGLAACAVMAGTLEDADRHAVRAEAVFTALGDAHGLLRVWLVRAGILLHRGRHHEAVAVCGRALALDEAACGTHRAAFLRVLGIATFESGRAADSLAHYEESLRLSRELGWRKGERITLRRLGEARTATGDREAGLRLLDTCLAMFRQAGDSYGEALTAYALGEVYLHDGEPARALRHFVACATSLSGEIYPAWTARAHQAVIRARAALRQDGRERTEPPPDERSDVS
ncbi:AfsR/SARP family transcriptional regulator [Saccharomonospora piscinae]|uniref:AfsR/SARP family transcriptional regulator n=1 Tax=Saccharomonospora piscinae TaxID=687388 RepID=UPI0004661F1A|nr:BTAD domain-containing putative transcriptional regulator [Saccharomonospora piscinae]